MVKRKQRHRITEEEARNAIIENMGGFTERSEARNVINHVQAGDLSLYALGEYIDVLFDLGYSIKLVDIKALKLRNAPKVIVHGDQISSVTFYEWGGYSLGVGFSLARNVEAAQSKGSLEEWIIRDMVDTEKAKMTRRLVDGYRKAGGGEPKRE